MAPAPRSDILGVPLSNYMYWIVTFLSFLSAATYAQTIPAHLSNVYPPPGAVDIARNTLLIHNRAGDLTFSTTLRVSGTISGGAVALERTNFANPLANNALRPATQLAPNTRYDVTIQAIPPNVAPSFSYSFTTGAGVDTTPPTLLSVSPQPGVPADPTTPVAFRFSEPLLIPGAERPEWGWLFQNLLSFGPVTSPRLRLSEDRTTILLEPYPTVRVIEVSLFLAALADTSGNFGATEPGHIFRFHRVSDAAAFTIQGRYPENGQTGVPTNIPVQLLFNRPAADNVRVWVNSAEIRVTANGQDIRVTGTFFARNRGILITPAGGWRPETVHKVTVSSSVYDVVGVPLGADLSFEFVSGKGPATFITPPLEATSPSYASSASSAPDPAAPPNTRLTILAANPLPPFVVNYVTSLEAPASGAVVTPFPIAVQPALSSDGRALTLTPSQTLPIGGVSADLPVILDVYGQEVIRQISFSIATPTEEEPFAVVGTTPVDGAVNANPTLQPRVAANRLLAAAQSEGALTLSRDGQTVPGRWRLAGGTHLAFAPALPLAADAEYVLTVDSLTDVTGATVSGGVVRFRTAPAGFVRPFTPTVITPPAGTTGLGLRQPIRVSFGDADGAADARCGVTARAPSTDSSVPSIPIAHTVSWQGTELTIAPLTTWPAGRLLTISCQSVDFARSQVSAAAAFTTESGTTTEPPVLLSADPPAGSIVQFNERIRLTFSEPVINTDDATPGFAWVGPVFSGPAQNGTVLWSADRRSASLSVSTLGGNYTLASTGTLTNFSGTRIAPFAVSYRLPGTTTYAKPSIRRLIPSRDSVVQDLNTAIILFLNGPLDLESLQRSVRVFADATPIPGNWSAAPGRESPDVFIFRPQGPLPPGAVIRFVDFSGVFGPYTEVFVFRTAPSPATGRRIVRFTGNVIPSNGVIEAELSEEAGPGEFTPQIATFLANGSRVSVPLRWERVRPRTYRAVLDTPLTVGRYLFVPDRRWPGPSPDSAVATEFYFDVVAPVTGTRPNVQLVAPARDAVDVPLNATLAIVFEELLNPLSIQPDSVSLRFNGASRPANVALWPTQTALFIDLAGFLIPANTTVDVEVQGLQDRLGRPIPSFNWRFQMGATFDSTGPALVWEPFRSTGGPVSVAIADPTRPLTLTYTEPLNPLRFLDPYRFVNLFGNLQVTQTLSADLKTLILQPSRDWPRGETFSLDSDAIDLAGNGCGSNDCPRQEIRFLLDPDLTPPVLESISIRDGDTDVPLNPYFSFGFDSPVDQGTYRQIRLLDGATEIPLRSTLNTPLPPSVLQVAPTGVLKPLTTYTLRIESASDNSGNTTAIGRAISFTTGIAVDFTPARVVQPSRVPVGGQPRIRFSEPVDTTSSTRSRNPLITTRDIGTQGENTRSLPARLVISDDRMEATLIPDRPLSAGRYNIGVPMLADRAGNRSSFGYLSEIEVTDAPEPPPVAIRISPPDGATGIPLNVMASIDPSRPLRSFQVRVWEEDRPFTAISVAALTIRFTQILKPDTRYRIEIHSAIDAANNPVAPVSSSFTTGPAAERTQLPALGVTPEDGASAVSPDAAVSFLFGRPVHPGTAFDSIAFNESGSFNRLQTAMQVNDSAVAVRGVPFWPPAALITGTMDPFRIGGFDRPQGPIDYAGNRPNRGLTVSFRTSALPDTTPLLVESVVPPAGSTLPAINNATITVRFSKPVIIAPNSAWVLVNGQQAANGCLLSTQDFSTCTFGVRLPPLADVKVVVTDGVKDYAGNAVAPFGLDYKASPSIAFGPVEAALIEPVNNPAPPSTVPAVRFDRSMDIAMVRSGLRVTENGVLVPGAIESVDDSNRTFRFRPDAPFAPGARIRVILPLSMQDAEGRTLSDWRLFPFEIQRPPASLSLLRASVLSEHPANAPIELNFSGPLDPGTVTGNTVWLTANGRLVPSRVTLASDNIVRLQPDFPLTPGLQYTVTAGSAIRGDGAFPGLDITFRAGEASEPQLDSVEEILWQGRPARRYRFSGPLTPAEAETVNGLPAFLSSDGRSFVTTAPSRIKPGERIRRPR